MFQFCFTGFSPWLKNFKICNLKVRRLKVRKILLILFLVSVMMVASIGTATAESILFPYIAANPGNLETLVTVINRAPAAAAGVGQLHYRYETKLVTGTETPDACTECDFYKPTTPNDVVTFAAGGSATLGSGNALFNDATTYTNAVIPGFTCIAGIRRGYILVTTANANADIGSGDRLDLDGEAVLYDIVNGAMWGYRALLSNQDTAGVVTTANSYVFGYQAVNRTAPVANALIFGKDVLSEGATTNANVANARFLQPVGILPPNQFQTAFFVTPLVRVTNAAIAIGDWDMRSAAANIQPRTRISMHEVNGNLGAYDRNENPISAGAPVEVRCVARVDLTDMHGTVWFGPTGALYNQGGWALVDLSDPAANAANSWAAGFVGAVGLSQDYSAFVSKLEYGTYTGFTGMINSAYILRDYAGVVTGAVPVAGDAGDIPAGLDANGVYLVGR
jgi:hypothetical protein